MVHGECGCGRVAFEVEGEFDYAFYCHCSRCRRRTGAACSAIGGVALDKVRIVAGAEHAVRLDESAKGYRCFCGICFGPLYSAVNGRAHIQLGALTDPPSISPNHHIYVGSKAPWHVITDDLPQHDELPL
ncbi:MAG TPA: GFA family protein [Polyangiaceae bacterium]|nr:GFA family protein [Polyangiaceae bacterium]